MTQIDEQESDKPLDPATEKVRKKMVRLLAVSIGIMMVGLMAVLGAIVYKISGKPETAEGDNLQARNGSAVPVEPGYVGRIDLPPGAEIVSESLDGSNILLRVRLEDNRSQLLVYNLAEDRIVARVAID
ncbi:MAG: fimbrial protein [Rhizobiaceae bacterium]